MIEDFNFEIICIDYPFFDTVYFTKENINRMFDTGKVSPPFYGNHVIVYSYNRKKNSTSSCNKMKEDYEYGN